MLQQEFEQRTGMTVRPEVYQSQIEPMYNMASDHIDKDVFCDEWRAHADSELLQDFFNQLCQMKKKVEELEKDKRKMAEYILDKADEHEDGDMYDKVCLTIGHNAALKYKMLHGYSLTDHDVELIVNTL